MRYPIEIYILFRLSHQSILILASSVDILWVVENLPIRYNKLGQIV